MSALLASARNPLKLFIVFSVLAIFSLFHLVPNAALVIPPNTCNPAPATAPQGPGIALAILEADDIKLPAPVCFPPPIILPAIPPIAVIGAFSLPS